MTIFEKSMHRLFSGLAFNLLVLIGIVAGLLRDEQMLKRMANFKGDTFVFLTSSLLLAVIIVVALVALWLEYNARIPGVGTIGSLLLASLILIMLTGPLMDIVWESTKNFIANWAITSDDPMIGFIKLCYHVLPVALIIINANVLAHAGYLMILKKTGKIRHSI